MNKEFNDLSIMYDTNDYLDVYKLLSSVYPTSNEIKQFLVTVYKGSYFKLRAYVSGQNKPILARRLEDAINKAFTIEPIKEHILLGDCEQFIEDNYSLNSLCMMISGFSSEYDVKDIHVYEFIRTVIKNRIKQYLDIIEDPIECRNFIIQTVSADAKFIMDTLINEVIGIKENAYAL